MTILLILENGNSTYTNVSKSFTMEMINECFLNKDYCGYGKVIECKKSNVNFY